jgi:hypothetical protein
MALQRAQRPAVPSVLASRRSVRHRLLTAALCAATLAAQPACSGGGLSPSEALALASPHFDHFAGFDRWTRRALAADPAFRSSSALEETLFAPVRREAPVVGVWIARENPERRLAFGHLDAPPKGAEWVRVRDEALGELEVTTAKIPDPRRRFREGEGDRAVLVRRTRPGSDGATVIVTVAYRVDSRDDG